MILPTTLAAGPPPRGYRAGPDPGLVFSKVPPAAAPTAAPAGWTALPTPSLCEPRMSGSHPGPLSNGSHVLARNEGLPLPGAQASPRLPTATLSKIVEDDARSRGARIEFFRSASGLLARGEPAAIEAARARIAEIERAADALAIDLDVELASQAAPAGDGAPASAAKPSASRRRSASRPGRKPSSACGRRPRS
jgi:hypothetical protein